MKIRIRHSAAVVLLSTTVAVGVVFGPGFATPLAVALENELSEPTIQVTIKNMAFHVTGYGREGTPTAVVVRNDDGVTHGFYSPLFKDTSVRLEGEGYRVGGREGLSYRVDPGKTITLHFTKGSAEGALTMMNPLMRHVIGCDMHPDVKGEVFIIERRGG